MADVDIRIRTIDQTGNGIRSIESKLKGFVSTIGTVTAGVTVMAGTFKKAFDFAEQGAQLEFIETKFNRLAVSIGSDSDTILAALTEVTRGTMTTAQMMDTASQIISLDLGKNEEDVVRLASLVTNLGWDMQQVILTFANDSKMRLDALGLSVEDVTRRAQEFEDAGHDASRAFDLAVLAAGEEKLRLVGSAADSSVGAFQRFRTGIQETTDKGKQWLAEGLTPIVMLLNDDYGDAVDAAVAKNLELAGSFQELGQEQYIQALVEELVKVREESEKAGAWLTGTQDELIQGQMELTQAIAANSSSFEEFKDNIEGVVPTGSIKNVSTGVHALTLQFMAFNGRVVENAEAFYRDAKAATITSNAYDYLIDQSIALTGHIQKTTFTADDLRSTQNALAFDLITTTNYYEGLGQTLVDVEAKYIGFASAADIINANLERQHALLIANNQAFGENYSQVLRTGETTFSAAESLLHFATQAGANATVLALLTAATGNYDRAQIASMLTHAALTTKAQELGTELANNNITVNQALTELEALQARMAQGLDIPGLPDTIQQVSNLKNQLLDVEGDYQVNVHTNYTSSGTPPNVPSGHNPNDPGSAQHFAEGGVVTGGIPGRDSVPALLMPGERVLSVDQNKAYERGREGGSSITINNYFSYPPPNPAAWAEQAADELGNKMRG